MFNPYLTIPPKITHDLEEIGAVFGYFRAVQLPDGYRKELISKVTAETVRASTAIEGNTLTEKQVQDVLSGKKIYAEDQDIKEIINYNNALEYIEKIAKEKSQTQLFIETPYRNNHLLEDILSTCDSRTQLCIACDITLPTEFIKTKSVFEWKKGIPEINKRPAIFLIYK